MKNVLLIAYHFPPIKVSSGIQRTLKFSQYLLDHGWRSIILTVNPRAYDTVSNDQLAEISDGIIVNRAQAFDTAKHLSLKGRYFRWMALPDRWVSWSFFGSLSGLALIVKYRPKIIFSTYPIATAHLIGLILNRLTRLPWVADFRDSMTEDEYPTDPLQRKVYRWIEQETIKHCAYAIFTTQGAIRMYSERYPDYQAKYKLIANGYDEENFVNAENSQQLQDMLNAKKPDQLVLVHSGILYPSERDPRQFFQALAELKQHGVVTAQNLKIILRATGHDDLYQPMLKAYAIDEIVELAPNIPYESALAEMRAVDGLLIFQAANCNHQIPAKIYEYLRAKKPIFALTDPQGDTAEVLNNAGGGYTAPLDNKDIILEHFERFLMVLRENNIPPLDESKIRIHSREARSKLLVNIFEQILFFG